MSLEEAKQIAQDRNWMKDIAMALSYQGYRYRKDGPLDKFCIS